MSALPLLKAPPPAPNGHVPNPRFAPAEIPRRERTGPPVAATVQLCLLDPAADADTIITAAVSVITTTDTAPGDRVMLVATGETPVATSSSQPRRDRLVEFVLRLGRGRPPVRTTALTTITSAPRRVAVWSTTQGPSPDSDPGRPTRPRRSRTRPAGSPPVAGRSGFRRFESITASWSEHPAGPSTMADQTPLLAPVGATVALTHSSDFRRVLTGRSGPLPRAAARAGVIVTDQLVPASTAASTAPSTSSVAVPCSRRSSGAPAPLHCPEVSPWYSPACSPPGEKSQLGPDRPGGTFRFPEAARRGTAQ